MRICRVFAVGMVIASFGFVFAVCRPSSSGETEQPVLVPLDSRSQASFRGVCVSDDQTIWVSGSGGTVLCSEDGGESWRKVGVPGAEDMDFRDVQAFDGKRALVLSAGSPAVVFKTLDGGRTWRETFRSTAPGVFFDSMAFWNEASGIAFSDPVDGAFLVITTDDGGQSWERIPSADLPPPGESEAGFAASGTCVAVRGSGQVWIGTGGATARVLLSSDRGSTWSASEIPLLQGEESQGVFSLAFRDSRYGLAVGGDYRDPGRRDGTAASTSDGGRTWQPVTGALPGGFRSCVALRPGGGGAEWVCTGTNGVDRSTDGGMTWVPLASAGYHSLAFSPSGSRAWLVGGEGRILRLEYRP